MFPREWRVKTGAGRVAAMEATQGQMNGFFGQLPYNCHLKEVASVGDRPRFALNSTPGCSLCEEERQGASRGLVVS